MKAIDLTKIISAAASSMNGSGSGVGIATKR
jgi:hypothetical protein